MASERLENMLEKELSPDDYTQELMFEIITAIKYAVDQNADRFKLLRNVKWPSQIEDLGLWSNNRTECQIYAPTNDWEDASNWVNADLNSKGYTELPDSDKQLQQIIHNTLTTKGKLYTLFLESNEKNWELNNQNQIRIVDN